MKDEKINSVAKKYVSYLSFYIDKDIDKAIRYANNEMYDEAVKMYNKFIKTFYSYRTTSYVRHWEGVPGTCEGQNLYFGMDIRKASKHPKLSIYMPSDEGYESNGGGQFREPMEDDYRYNTAQEVLEYVSEGIRFPDEFEYKIWKDRGENTLMTWDPVSYSGRYFRYKGTMKDAFDRFNDEFDTIARKPMMKYLKTLGY